MYDGAGNVIGLLGIFWDVTEKHRAEEALEYERYLLHMLMDNLPTTFISKRKADSCARIVLCSSDSVSPPGKRLAKRLDFFTDEHARQATRTSSG